MNQRPRPAPISAINVVPYIDVMLVLLVVFMVTAPLLRQGVEVKLPKAPAEPIKRTDTKPLVLEVDARGRYFLNMGDNPKHGLGKEVLLHRVAAILQRDPDTPVLVRGDEGVEYGQVVEAMALLQGAGAPSVGLVTESPEPSAQEELRETSVIQ